MEYGAFLLWMVVTCAVMAAVTVPFIGGGQSSEVPDSVRNDGSFIS